MNINLKCNAKCDMGLLMFQVNAHRHVSTARNSSYDYQNEKYQPEKIKTLYVTYVERIVDAAHLNVFCDKT